MVEGNNRRSRAERLYSIIYVNILLLPMHSIFLSKGTLSLSICPFSGGSCLLGLGLGLGFREFIFFLSEYLISVLGMSHACHLVMYLS